MLNDVIAVLILDELFCVHVQFIEDRRCLFGWAVLEDSLYDAATVGMCAQSVDLPVEGVDDEL